MDTQVLVVGAGPSGLVLALWLAKAGVPVRIVDKLAQAGTTSRALAVQARTLELYDRLGLTEAVLAQGHKTPGVNLWAEGKRKARLGFESIGEDLTRYSFLEMYPQDAHERMLIQRLAEVGVEVEREIEVLGFDETQGGVVAKLRAADGTTSTCQAAYIAGCDGAHSVVRHTIGVGFPGGTYKQIFYVADITGSGPPMNGELHVDLDVADFLAIFPLSGGPHARLIGTVRDERAEHPETLTFEDVSRGAIQNLGLHVEAVNWFSSYRVHHRVCEKFRVGRAFLVGDAAHIHSPAGGQGMNTGIGDAINLAWKLAAVVQGQAPDGLLDSYEIERRAFAERLVVSTDRAFSIATAEGRVADIIRTRIAPAVFPTVMAFEPFREFAFRTISQVTLNYRDMPLSEGRAGEVRGGDRLAWARIGESDNFASFHNGVDWQVHVYGEPAAGVADWCAEHGIALHRFDWTHELEAAGLARNGLYLLRPDTYVALAGVSASPAALERYVGERGLMLN
jgi:2-polyprenyl-6-methoxyphenol hydroxylase-like FAD-dependent oxidoreductase